MTPLKLKRRPLRGIATPSQAVRKDDANAPIPDQGYEQPTRNMVGTDQGVKSMGPFHSLLSRFARG